MKLFSRNILIILILCLTPFLFYYSQNKVLEKKENFFKGEIISAVQENIADNWLGEFIENQTDLENFQQNITVKILTWTDKNKTIKIINEIYNPYLSAIYKTGDQVVILKNNFNNQDDYVISNYWYLEKIFWLSFAVILCILLIGGKQGVKTILSLGLSLFLILKLLLPGINNWIDPLFLSIWICIIITIVTIYILMWFGKKGIISLISTISGILVSLIISQIFNFFLQINGSSNESARLLTINFPDLNLTNILFAGILIGSLGAVMDISISISSSLEEIKKHHPQISGTELFHSGMKIGRDMMGSMFNTLIFAYVGSSLFLLLFLMNNNTSLIEFFNFSFLAEEYLRSLAGTTALLFTIPITSGLAMWQYKN